MRFVHATTSPSRRLRSAVTAISAVGLMLVVPVTTDAQFVAGNDGLYGAAPRFLAARSDGSRTALRIESVPALSRRITLDTRATRQQLLDEIASATGVRMVYSRDYVLLSDTVEVRAAGLSVAAALTEVLLGANVDLLVQNTSVVLVPRSPRIDVLNAPPPVDGRVTGRVLDESSGTPVNLAVVSVDSREVTATDDAGNFALTLPAGTHELRVRRIGYLPMTRSVRVTDGETLTLELRLARVVAALDQVVTTATGPQSRARVGNAISSVAVDSIMTSGAPVVSLTDLLQGRASGLQVYSSGGLSGVASSIRIRGTNSITVNNDPIVIVDGARIESAGTGAGGLQGTRPGRLSDINLYDIESIDVLKGPSAATLYGSDAANGVVVIKTKRGTAGAPRWRFWSEQSQSEATDHFSPLYYPYGTNNTTGAVQRCTLAQVSAQTCRQDSVVTWNPLEDAATTPLTTGRRHSYGAQVQGGVQGFTYFLSGDLARERGYLRLPAAEQERLRTLRGTQTIPDEQINPNRVSLLTLRANVGSAIGARGRFNLSNGLTFNRSSIPATTGIFSSGAAQGTSAPTVNGGWFLSRPGEQFALQNVDNTVRLTSSAAANVEPTSWLTARGMVGIDLSHTVFEALQRNGEGPPASAAGARQDNRYNIRLLSGDFGTTANLPLGASFASRTSVGVQYNRRTEFNALTSGTTLTPGSTTLAGAATTTSSENTTETIVAGMYIEEQLAFRERLFLTGAIRFDGGSAFGADFSTASYPKGAISWVAIDRTRSGTADARLPWLSSFRLRAAAGASGVQPSAIAARQRDCLSSAFVNGAAVSAALLCQLGNSQLRPERQQEVEGGFDASFFNDRLRIIPTYYDRRSRDAIMTVTLAPSASNITRPVNLGAVQNRGFDIDITSRVLDKSAVSLDLGLSGNSNHNKLRKLGAGVDVTATSRHQPGYPIFSQFGYPYTYNDADGNGILIPAEVTVATTAVWMGTSRPQRTFSGTATLGLFNNTLRFSALADYRDRFIVVNGNVSANCGRGACRALVDPKASLADQAAAIAITKNSSALGGFTYDGRYLRVSELSAAYTIPRRAARAVGARGAQLLLAGRNISRHLSDYPGFSLEASVNGDQGITGVAPPLARTWTLRLSLDY